MSTQVLGDNLLALIKAYDYRGIPMPIVRRIAKQVLVALAYLHTTCSIIHTDLKPENIMLTQALKPRKFVPLPPNPASAAHASNGAVLALDSPICQANLAGMPASLNTRCSSIKVQGPGQGVVPGRHAMSCCCLLHVIA